MAKEEFDSLPEGATLIGDTEEFDTLPEGATLLNDDAPAQSLPEGAEMIQDKPVIEGKEPGFEIAGLMSSIAPEMETAKRAWKIGKMQVDRGRIGMKAAFGSMPSEEALEKSNELKASTDQDMTPEFKFTEPATWKPGIVSEVTQLLPYMLEASKKGLEYGIAGAGTGALVGGMAVPAIGAIPGAMTGAKIGAGIGVVKETAEIEGGNLYLDLVEDGVSHETARNISIPAGVFIGLVEASEIGVVARRLPGLNKFFKKKLMDTVVNNPALRQSLMKVSKNFLGDVAFQAGQEEVQELISIGGEALAKAVDEAKKDKVIKDQPTWESTLNRMGQVLKTSLIAFPFLQLPGAVTETVSAVKGEKKTAPKTAAQPIQQVEQPPAKMEETVADNSRFATPEEAKAYGKQIGGDEVKIGELKANRDALIQAGAKEQDINKKFLILQRAQLLREAIDEAKKVRPKKVEAIAPQDEIVKIDEAIGKSKANHVVFEVRGEDGSLTERMAMPYDGTPEGAVNISKQMQNHAKANFGGPTTFSWQTSKIGITGQDGNLKWVMVVGAKPELVEPDAKTAEIFYGQYGKQEQAKEKPLTPKVNKTEDSFDPKKRIAQIKANIKAIKFNFKSAKNKREVNTAKKQVAALEKELAYVEKTGKPFVVKARKPRTFDIAKAVDTGDRATLIKSLGLSPTDPEVMQLEQEERNKLFPFFRKNGMQSDTLLQSLKESYPQFFSEYGDGPSLLAAMRDISIYKKMDLDKLIKEQEAKDAELAEQATAEGFTEADVAQAKADDQREQSTEQSDSDREASERDQRLRDAITGIEALVDESGNLTRGTDFIRDTYLADLDEEGMGALQIWAARHKNPQIRRIIGDEIAAIMRADAEAEKNTTPTEGDQTLIPGTEKPSYKKAKFGAPRQLPEQSQEALDLQKASNSDKQKTLFQEAEPELYSLALKMAEQKIANNATPVQIIATLKNNGVKQEEIDWMGLEQFLAGKDRVSKKELLEFIRQNQVNVKETVLGENKYAEKIEELKRRGEWLQGQRDGIIDHSIGNDLSIHLEKRLADLRAESDIVNEEIERLESQSGGAARWDTSNYVTPGLTNKREIVLSVPGIEPFDVNDTNHYGDIEKGTAIVWIRAGDSVIDGKKTLMIDEIQSKRHQKGREKGYQGEAVKYGDRIEGYTPVGHEWKKTTRPDKNYVIHQLVNSATGNVVAEGQVKSEILKKSGLGNGVPNAPFKKTWHELALKKILRMAVEGGYDAIAWTTGEQQAERYDLSKQVDRIEYELYGKDNATVTIEKNGNVLEQMEHANREEVTKMLGKEIAEKIFNDKGTSIADGVSELAGLDLKVGGEGMKGFYDQMIPQFLNKYTKKWGGRVLLANIGKQDAGRISLPDSGSIEKYSGLALNPVDEIVGASADNGKILKAIIQSIPTNVMNILASNKINAENFVRNPKMFSNALPSEVAISVSDGIRNALSDTRTLLRAGFNASFETGLDREILPALRASDFDTDVASRIAFPEKSIDATSGGGADIGMSFGGTETGAERSISDSKSLAAKFADFVKWHKNIVSRSRGDVESNLYHRLDITPSMRDSVLAGQPMFQTQASAKASSFEVEAAKLKEILEIHGIESVTIELANKIITPRGTRAFGAYSPESGKVKMVAVPKDTTGYHESFHILAKSAFTEDRMQDVFDSVKNDEIQTDAQAEEYLAERFAKYANKRNSAGLSDKVVAFFEDLLYFIKRIMGFSSKTENLFNEMLHPDYYVPSAPVAHASQFYQEVDDPETNEARRNWKLSDRSKAIIQKYAERVGEGYVPRGNLGVFYPGTKNIFVQALNDVSTVVHEVTHYIDKKNRLAEKVIASTGRGDKVRKEITRIYVNLYGKGNAKHKLSKRITEGIAVLIENYAMNPEAIKTEYPDLVSLFIAPSGRYHVQEIAELIKDTQALMAEYRGIGAFGRGSARVTDKRHKPAASTYFGYWDKVKNFVKDDLWKLEKLEILKGFGDASSPSNWSRILRNVGSLVARNMQVGKGFWSWRGGDYAKVLDFNWGDLIKKTQDAGTSHAFGVWLVHRRQYFMWKSLADAPAKMQELQENLETADPEEQKEIVAEIQRFKAQTGKIGEILAKDKFDRRDVEDVYMMFVEDFKDEAAMFDALVRADIEMLADPQVMLLKPEERDRMIREEGYATFHRDVYNDIVGEKGVFVGGPAGTSASFLKERVGSELDIFNPLYGQLLNHAEAMRKALRQTVYNKLLQLGKKVPELFQPQSLIAIPQNDGRIEFPQSKDENFFMARENYKRVPVQINAKIKELVDMALNPRNMDAFEKFLLATKRIFTVGTTSAYPPFAIKNFARDQVTAWALSVNDKFTPFYGSINALRSALINTETEEARLAEEYFALGGERQTLAGLYDKEPGEVLEMVSKEVAGIKSMSERIEKGAETVISILSVPAKYSEYATRLSEYILSRKAGKSQVQAMEDAGRVSGSFHHFGSFGGTSRASSIIASLWRTIPFANPRMQVFWQMLERMNDKNPQLRAKAWTVFAVMSALSTTAFVSLLAFGDDDDKEQYKNIKPQMLSSYLYFPNPLGKGLLTFPIPNELGVLGAATNSVIANIVLDARYTTKEFLDIASSALPDQINLFDIETEGHAKYFPLKAFASLFPQFLSPAFGYAFNIKTYPEVGEIDRYPKYAGNEKYNYCSKVAIQIGKWADISPAKIDYFLQGYLSRSIKFIPGFGPSDKGWLANAIDKFQGGILSKYYLTSGRNLRDYNEIKTRNQTDWAAYTNKERDFTAEEIATLKWNRNILLKNKYTGAKGLNQLVQMYRELSDGDVSKDTEKARKIREMIIHKIARLRR